MLKSVKVLLCLLLAVCSLLPGCSLFGNSANDKASSAADIETSNSASAVPVPPTTAPATAALTASSDSAAPVDDSAITYNSYEIKKNIDEIDETLDHLLDYHSFSGAVYIKCGNDYEAIRERGTANQGAHIKNSIHTSVYAGELTRLVTAIAVLQLTESKGLNLQATLDGFFPDCAYAKDVTVEQLLTMTSGIPDYVEGGASVLKSPVPELEAQLKETDAAHNRQAVLSWILKQQRPLTAPAFSPCNSNYFLLGEIIARVSGENYEDYISNHILRPLYMTKSGFTADESTARAYTGSESSAKMLYPGVGSGALGFVTDVSDLLKLVDGIMTNRIVSERLFQKLFTDYGSGYGYGAEVSGIRVTCSGSLDAYKAKLSFTTNNNQIYIALSNETDSSPDEIHRLFREYLVKFRN